MFISKTAYEIIAPKTPAAKISIKKKLETLFIISTTSSIPNETKLNVTKNNENSLCMFMENATVEGLCILSIINIKATPEIPIKSPASIKFKKIIKYAPKVANNNAIDKDIFSLRLILIPYKSNKFLAFKSN